jgi:ADP-ribose pyrophosphatase YjhB (NUDIX family)
MAASICTEPQAAVSEARDYPTRPWVGVGVVVWRADRVLLIRRGRPPRTGEWGIPGGAQAVGETVFDAAIREVREETGVAIRPVGIIDVVDSITRDGMGAIQYHYTLIEVLAEWLAGEAVAASDAEAVRWASPAEAAGLVRWAETLRIIEAAARLRRSL